jgi:hypothetical protein
LVWSLLHDCIPFDFHLGVEWIILYQKFRWEV